MTICKIATQMTLGAVDFECEEPPRPPGEEKVEYASGLASNPFAALVMLGAAALGARTSTHSGYIQRDLTNQRGLDGSQPQRGVIPLETEAEKAGAADAQQDSQQPQPVASDQSDGKTATGPEATEDASPSDQAKPANENGKGEGDAKTQKRPGRPLGGPRFARELGALEQQLASQPSTPTAKPPQPSANPSVASVKEYFDPNVRLVSHDLTNKDVKELSDVLTEELRCIDPPGGSPLAPRTKEGVERAVELIEQVEAWANGVMARGGAMIGTPERQTAQNILNVVGPQARERLARSPGAKDLPIDSPVLRLPEGQPRVGRVSDPATLFTAGDAADIPTTNLPGGVLRSDDRPTDDWN